jgi:hypothetical protein
MRQIFKKTVICLLALIAHTNLWATVPNDDKPTKNNTAEVAPNNASVATAKILLNKKLSNSLDKALFLSGVSLK